MFENWITENLDKLEHIDGQGETKGKSLSLRDSMIRKNKDENTNSTSYGI